MPKFILPNEVVDNESGAGDSPFPKGTWQGVIEKVRIREIHEGEGGDFFLKDSKTGAYFAEWCEIASIQIGSNEGVLAGQRKVGERKYFEENILLSYDGLNWDEYPNPEEDPRWRLGLTQRRLTKLAKALGLVDETPDGVGPVDHFDELFRATDDESESGLNGMAVRFKVVHRSFKTRDGEKKTEAQTAQFYPAA